MKKLSFWLVVIIMLASTCVLGFSYKKNVIPNSYYQVFLNDKLLGTVTSETELKNYINENGNFYKRKYNVDTIYEPKGLHINKIVTYDGKISSVKEVYNKIKDKAAFTVKGYEITIKSKQKDENNKEKINNTKINVLKESTFKKAVTTLINTYVGKDRYNLYEKNEQTPIDTTGEIIDDVYVNEDITIKETNIPINKKIYTDETELSKLLLYGDKGQQQIYTVRAGDTVDKVAFNNKISTEELLLSNDNLNSTANLLYPGQQLKIEQTNPKISIVEESSVVKDLESAYKTEERYDKSLIMGDENVIQEGQNGLERVSQKVRKVNGEITYVDPQGKQVLKAPVSRIVVKGTKYVSGVGSLTNWGWPTDSGWTMSSGYQYRYSPVGRGRELHTGLDISGTGYGSKIYATNNGVVVTANYHYSYGNHVVINHNNGYLTLYGHMSRIAVKAGQKVARGQVIGYVGCTGDCTGPHVHYEVWKGCEYCHVNPSILYPRGYR